MIYTYKCGVQCALGMDCMVCGAWEQLEQMRGLGNAQQSLEANVRSDFFEQKHNLRDNVAVTGNLSVRFKNVYALPNNKLTPEKIERLRQLSPQAAAYLAEQIQLSKIYNDAAERTQKVLDQMTPEKRKQLREVIDGMNDVG